MLYFYFKWLVFKCVFSLHKRGPKTGTKLQKNADADKDITEFLL